MMKKVKVRCALNEVMFPKVSPEQEKEVIDSILDTRGTRSCSWYASLPSNISETIVGKYIPGVAKFLHYVHKKCLGGDTNLCGYVESGSGLATVKTCPGVRGVLSNSIVVRSPCDVNITISDNGGWVYNSSNLSLLELTEDHPPEQFGAPFKGNKDRSLFSNNRVIKIKLPLLFATANNTPYLYLDPQFHVDTVPLKVVLGQIDNYATKKAPLNIITMFKIPEKGETLDIHIKKGTVLAYLWFPNSYKLEITPSLNLFSVIHDKFVNSFGAKNANDSNN
jgi:hypothetical protein